jgi:hypothetical protein
MFNCPIVIVDAGQNFGLQVLHACEGSALEQLAHQYREPDLKSFHPRTMMRGEVKNDCVGGIAQERHPARHEGYDAV